MSLDLVHFISEHAQPFHEVLDLIPIPLFVTGGDEFCILVPEFDNKEQLQVLAERVVNSISCIHQFDGMGIDIGCSIGIAVFPDNAKTLSDLTASADKAMYIAKRSQGYDFCFVE